jgi:drug/metabolite transporter (DMT)-like permease
MPTTSRRYGVVLVLTATFLFSIHDATTKYLMAFFGVPLLIFSRYLINVALVLAAAGPQMGRELIVTRRPALMLLRAALLVVTSIFFQTALKTLPLPEATAIAFMTPLIIALLAGPILGEKVKLKAWIATAAGFCGVLLIARPGGTTSTIGVVLALASAFCFANYQLLTRKLSATEPAMRLLFHTALIGTLSMALFLPVYWFEEWPSPTHALLIVSLGFTASIGHFLLIRAYHVTPASTLAPLLYSQIVWAMLLGAALFGHLPDPLTLAGMLCIGLSCLSLVWRRRTAIG